MKEYLKLNNEIRNEYDRYNTINREKDKEATKRYFLDEINENTVFFHNLKEKLDYLVEEGYYEKEFLNWYDFNFIKSIFKRAYSYKFRFPTFMSASKFYNSYALKTRDGKRYLERYEDRVAINALVLANGNKELAKKGVDYIMRSIQPATPTFNSVGKKARGEYVSCFKISMDDSMNNIAYNISNALQLSKLGGGVGIGMTDLRCVGDPIKGIENRASGVMPVAKLLENSFTYANQLGQRQGSGVIWLNIFHGDIEDFISAKKPNADEKIRLATLSTGVVIPDIFFELMQEDKDMYLFSPYDIYNEYGKRMSEINMTEMYHKLIDNPNIRKLKKLNTRKLYTEIKKSQIESGYPFEMFDDNVNNAHPLKGIARVKISNLCTEVLELQITSVIGDFDGKHEFGLDVSCNLQSLDIHNAVKEKSFEDLIDTSMRLLTTVSDVTNIKQVPSVAKGNEFMHSVGLGAMNLHGHLMDNNIQYESKEAIEFVDVFFTAMNYFTLKTSCAIAKERKEAFYRFKDSEYAKGTYFDKYRDKELKVTSDKVKKALGNVPIITSDMWMELEKDVKKYGLYHSYRQAIAPTGSISYIRSSTASVSPITEQVEIRDYGDSRTVYPMPFLTNENKSDYKVAYDMDMYKVIDLYATMQQHIDQGLSMTLYITDQFTTADLAKIYIYAWTKGIKTVYYVRQRMSTLEECVSCSI